MKVSNGTSRHRRQSLPRFRDGYCTAAIRALTGAGLVISGKAPSYRVAALRCGSTVTYIGAAVTLLRSENHSLMAKVAKGQMPLLAAAQQTKRLAKVVSAFRQATAADRVAFAKTIGPSILFDHTLVPAL
jgi:hypothetical protein